ncbi:MAG: bifunctional DNA-formamidopyrimidine glycosylase/DNA-(apurinic or apyrimidinic site) lyase [bacterium]|nr:bifunctional DNA-formamidopyrimidine glycosylase/DNA-(apurinic or apyrimidinic site) lyase [bacterium]
MPELPEVETIVRGLSRRITGKKLSRFLVYDKKRLVSPRLSLPKKIVAVRRHGKYIVCDMTSGLRCLVHLRMTGELLLGEISDSSSRARDEGKQKASKHERARFNFSDGSFLRFIDVRRFGTIEWLKDGRSLPSLGPDPLSRGFNTKILFAATQKSLRAIKSLLLDQKIIAGIGNIYTDESLWMAKIHPRRESKSLKLAEISRLVKEIKQILREGIKKGGFTLRDYRRIDGSSGYYQHSRKAYDREDLPCLRCRAKIKRIKVGGRSSYFCARCQK